MDASEPDWEALAADPSYWLAHAANASWDCLTPAELLVRWFGRNLSAEERLGGRGETLGEQVAKAVSYLQTVYKDLFEAHRQCGMMLAAARQAPVETCGWVCASAQEAVLRIIGTMLQHVWEAVRPGSTRLLEPHQYGALGDSELEQAPWAGVEQALSYIDGPAVLRSLDWLSAAVEQEHAAASARLESEPRPEAAEPATADEPWVPAGALWRARFETYEQFRAWLDRTPDSEVRRRHPRPNRLEIHAADWVRYWTHQDEGEFEGLDRPGEDWPSVAGDTPAEYIADAAARLRAIRARKQAPQ